MSSTKEIALASPFSAIDRPSASVRSFQMRSCCGRLDGANHGGRIVAPQIRFQTSRRGDELLGSVAVELDDQDRAGIALRGNRAAGPPRGSACVQSRMIPVHDLDRRGPMREDRRRRGQSVEQVGELHDEQRLGVGQLDEPQLRFEATPACLRSRRRDAPG